MARAQEENSSLRFSRAEIARLAAALFFSALVHLAVWSAYHTGHRLGWWERGHLPAWLHSQAKPLPLPQRQIALSQDPTIFVDVSHADADTPQATRYYSDRSSRAANPDAANSSVPRIEGRQQDMPKTEDAARPVKGASAQPETAAEANEDNADARRETAEKKQPDLTRLHPSPPSAAETAEQSESPEAPLTPGETALPPKPLGSNPSPEPTPAGAPAASRPRTIKQALARRDQIPGRAMRQDGGVARHAMWSSLDVKSTPFGEYDRAIVDAVSQRWYDLLDSRQFADDRTGKVTLHFKLKSDGSVIEVETVENNVGELLGYLCQKAIEEAAPFGKWPPDMVRMVGSNSRDITFTFYYY